MTKLAWWYTVFSRVVEHIRFRVISWLEEMLYCPECETPPPDHTRGCTVGREFHPQ